MKVLLFVLFDDEAQVLDLTLNRGWSGHSAQWDSRLLLALIRFPLLRLAVEEEAGSFCG